MKKIKKIVVYINGSEGRLGSSFSKAIVENGGNVILGDISNKKLSNNFNAKNSLFIKGDHTKIKVIDNTLKLGLKKFGKIDAAINCCYPKTKKWGQPFEKLDEKHLKENIFSQLGSPIIFSQRVIKFFRKQGFGNLIYVSSIQGISPPKFDHYKNTNMTSPIEYSAVKSGIISITKYLAKYCGKENIRVNCITPGGILDNQPKIFKQKYKKSCLNKGLLDSADLNGTILYLLSEESKYVNGQNIIIDDGWSL